MAREISTEIEINASPAAVWRELTNFSAYPSWNPFIQSIDGPLHEGSRLTVLICPPNNKEMRFKPVIRTVEEAKEIVWKGKFLIPGLFDGEHGFELIPLSTDRTRFVQKEKFSGVLVPLFWSMLDRDTRQGFIDMNKALKARCEGA
ncbi:MAG: SRPBCC domain-containing protein [Glaciimonas sp.]|nr:SRPBCC domain-containing protein [Glaciimonas sp.]